GGIGRGGWRIRSSCSPPAPSILTLSQGRTDNSWGPREIGDHGAPVSLPKLKKAYEKGTMGHLMGPPTDPGHLSSARVSKWSVCPCLNLIVIQ
ncbi:unnamed protein product, partial [Staurois parvus]